MTDKYSGRSPYSGGYKLYINWQNLFVNKGKEATVM